MGNLEEIFKQAKSEFNLPKKNFIKSGGTAIKPGTLHTIDEAAGYSGYQAGELNGMAASGSLSVIRIKDDTYVPGEEIIRIRERPMVDASYSLFDIQ